MIFTHKFTVDAPVEKVAALHRKADTMAKITPPPIVVQFHSVPELISRGDIVDFTMWIGPFPLRWTALMDSVTPTGFLDRQIFGIFDKWEHRHIFVPYSDTKTCIVDCIEVELAEQWTRRLAGCAMWAGMPGLFAYRKWKTRRLLGNSP